MHIYGKYRYGSWCFLYLQWLIIIKPFIPTAWLDYLTEYFMNHNGPVPAKLKTWIMKVNTEYPNKEFRSSLIIQLLFCIIV